MTTGELYARARVAFVAFPSVRLYTRRVPHLAATRVVAETEVGGHLWRGSVAVGDETLFRDDVARVDRLVALLRGRVRFVVAMRDAQATVTRMGQSMSAARDAIASFERVRVELERLPRSRT